jgi:hypothetical protein
MKDFRDRSKERFEEEVSKLLKDLMVSCLDRAEKIFYKSSISEDSWKQFRFNILNLGNDKIRIFREKLVDYSIEFRPPIFSVKYNVDVPQDKIAAFKFSFKDGKVPVFTVSSTIGASELLKTSLECGVCTKQKDGTVIYTVEGMYDIFNKVIPFADRTQCFRGKTLEEYKEWKELVYKQEKGDA